MTAEEKRDRRAARHELQLVFLRHATRRIGLFSRTGQLKKAAKTLTDRYYKEQVNPAVERIVAR